MLFTAGLHGVLVLTSAPCNLVGVHADSALNLAVLGTSRSRLDQELTFYLLFLFLSPPALVSVFLKRWGPDCGVPDMIFGPETEMVSFQCIYKFQKLS